MLLLVHEFSSECYTTMDDTSGHKATQITDSIRYKLSYIPNCLFCKYINIKITPPLGLEPRTTS